MANSDILVTAAGKFQPAMWDIKKQKALLILAKMQGVSTYTGANPTRAQLATLVANMATAFTGIGANKPSLLAVQNAVWWKNAEVLGGGAAVAVAGVSANTRFGVCNYLAELSNDDLDKLNAYVEGLYLTVLT